MLAGTAEALLATVCIFLPAFAFVALAGPIIPRLRNSQVMTGLLDGANVGSLALMAGVTFQLGRSSVVEPIPALLTLAALALLFWTTINPA